MTKIAVLGAGAWGTALAKSACESADNQVILWFYDQKVLEVTAKNHKNPFLAKIKLPKRLFFTASLKTALSGANIVLMATPAQATPGLLKKIKKYWRPEMIMVNCAKGIDIKSGRLISESVALLLPTALKNYTVLSGPSFAEELALGHETAVVIASKSLLTAKKVQVVLAVNGLRPYTAQDFLGTEVAGAYKNVIAIAAGILDGLGKGENLQAALLARGLREMRRFGLALGAKSETFNGLAGIGDLALTARSRQSRNYSFGRTVGGGGDRGARLGKGSPVVEGYYTVRSLRRRARQMKLQLTIVEAVYNILYLHHDAEKIIEKLMRRQLTPEKYL
ncbi:hypothetical protein COT94_03705 [Candidatus Falkowbacteria bacterium CG10_big_fil_rev_8_21_14_0_10_37_14]|uniref:Glycerol-3-phosphate dehydrogenase [NAD(P)+] n=1 Tax=Candidatus Falkowbacteria bacterium CG10_big_fil_rev_8_21_14_0_10_37_14 TaxID=1974561 RepID=A0A2M6WSQ7_9BACT|nr:NAD(P)-dependent glycerol-3-phosphate dehydrogenase [Candidatus Falkowbacteria bacterium]PIT95837.1 MAG: hypothetical protein COT94_03705 [Candidatus Falkowbacteria bacterium CG10_big_fil_rev_8_21_14_0_10_37_14]